MGFTDRIKGMFKGAKNTSQAQSLYQEVSYSDPTRLFADGVMRYNPSELVTRKGLRIFDKMRKDDQIKAAMSFKKHAVLSSGWEIESPKGKPEDWEVKVFLEDMFNNIEGTLYESLFSILSALEYGYSISEKVYSQDESNRIVLKALKTNKPHSFEFRSDKFGNLIELRQAKSQVGYTIFTDGEKLPIDKFAIFTNQKEFGNHYGISDYEAAYRPWLIKDNSYKWLAMALERRGIPALFALYDSSKYHPALISDLKDVLKNIQASTVGVVPRQDPESLEFFQPKSIADTKNIFVNCIEMFNRDIARALLMPGLLGMTADDKSGSYARAKIHFDVFLMTIEYLRKRLEDRVMMEQIIRPLVDLNFGGVDDYPIFRFSPITEENQLDLMTKWTEMVKIGAFPVTPDDEAHVRNIIKFPEREILEEEPPLEQTPPPPSPGQGNTPASQAPVEGEGLSPSEPPVKQSIEDFERIREVNLLEGLVNFERINTGLDKIESQSKEALIKLLTSTRDSLIRFVKNNQEELPRLIKSLKLKGMGQVQDVIGEMLRASYRFGFQEIKKETSGKEEMGAGLFTPTEALSYLSQKKFWVAGVMKDSILKDTRSILFNSMKSGETLTETQQKINTLFEPWIGTEGILKETEKGFKVGTPFHLETIIRTNTTDAFNQGRIVGAQEVAKFLHGMEYSAILDARTTEQCALLDGRIFPMDSPELGRFTPPLHFNCRSILVPVSKSEEVKASDFIDPTTAGKANSLVPSSFGGSAGKG